MKKPVVVALAVTLAIVAIAIALVAVTGPKALHVRDVSRNPQSYTGTITITGIMGGVSRQDPSIFGIMDMKELECRSPNCEKLLIPVRHRGIQPVAGDEVKVTGTFVNLGSGLLFDATKVKVVRNHKIKS